MPKFSLHQGVPTGAFGLAGTGAIMIAPTQLWIGYVLLACAGSLFLWGLRINGQHLWGRWWSSQGISEDSRAALIAWLERISTDLGTALATDSSFFFEEAAATIEQMFFKLRKVGIKTPILWGDGAKLGVIRAHRFLIMLRAPLLNGEYKAEARRAAQIVPLLNVAPEAKLMKHYSFFLPSIPPAVQRDVSLTQGLMYVATGEWGHERCDWEDGLELKLNPHRKQFEQLAADGKLTVWGKPPELERGVFVKIDAEFWREFQVEWLSLLLGVPQTEARTGFPHRYHPFTHLMISKAEFEKVDWQHG